MTSATNDLDPEVLASIEEALEDRGHLSLEDLELGWHLDEATCEQVLRALASRPDVRRGRGQGRHRIHLLSTSKAPVDGEDDGDGFVLTSEWQSEAIERLVELLKYKDLESLLEGLLFTLRRAREMETGKNRRGSKRELSAALVLKHGTSLLAEPAIRKRVGKAARVSSPGRWHPGKAAALAFVENTGFPAEMVGDPTPSAPPSVEHLLPRRPLDPLAPFQNEVVRKLLLCLYEPDGRAMVSLPTGAGKTRVAVEMLVTWFLDRWDHERERAERGVVVWLAHTEELCEQAIECFRDVWQSKDVVPPVALARCWGRFTSKPGDVDELEAGLTGPAALISTPDRLASLMKQGSPLIERVRDHAGLVVIDEAHRAAAPTYRRILDFLEHRDAPLSVLGLTATPFRMEYHDDAPQAGTRELREIFGQLIEPTETLGFAPRLTLQKMKVLATPEVETLETSTAIRMDEGSNGPLMQGDIERIDHFLALRTDRTPRRLEIFQRILPLVEDPDHQILYFGPSVQDAECMAFLLLRRGVPAAVVSGESRRSARRQVIEQFKAGKVRVLCNCEVLTTGFDAPRVTHVVMGRPTVSQVMYEQMVGRGLRGPRFGGTSYCTIIDCVDDYRGRRPQLGYEAFRDVWCSKEEC